MDSLETTEKSKKAKKKDKKRKYCSNSNESENESSSKRLKGKHKKKCKKKHKCAKDKKHKKDKSVKDSCNDDKGDLIGPEIPNDLLKKAQSMAPMSKDEWEKRQNTIRRVYDEETGRTRLIRGEGEIIEEIVSKERHQEINRQATQGDGEFFQSNIKKHTQ